MWGGVKTIGNSSGNKPLACAYAMVGYGAVFFIVLSLITLYIINKIIFPGNRFVRVGLHQSLFVQSFCFNYERLMPLNQFSPQW